MDICFIIDTSVSVFPDEWDDLRWFISDTIDSMDIGPTATQVGFVTYSNSAKVSAHLDAYATVDEAKYGVFNDVEHLNASTRTHLGLEKAATECFTGPGDRPDYENLAILLTDGRSSTPVTDDAAKLRDVAKIVAVGIDLANDVQLVDIVGGDASRWFKVAKFSDLGGQVAQLMSSSCG